jgi:hypothetical protein
VSESTGAAAERDQPDGELRESDADVAALLGPGVVSEKWRMTGVAKRLVFGAVEVDGDADVGVDGLDAAM